MKPGRYFFIIAFVFICVLHVNAQSHKPSLALKNKADSFRTWKKEIRKLIAKHTAQAKKSDKLYARYRIKYGDNDINCSSPECIAWYKSKKKSDSIWACQFSPYYKIIELFDSLGTGLYNPSQILSMVGLPDSSYFMNENDQDEHNTANMGVGAGNPLNFLFMETQVLGIGERQRLNSKGNWNKMANPRNYMADNVIFYYALPGRQFHFVFIDIRKGKVINSYRYMHLE